MQNVSHYIFRRWNNSQFLIKLIWKILANCNFLTMISPVSVTPIWCCSTTWPTTAPLLLSVAFALCHFVLTVSTTFIFTPHINANCAKTYKHLTKNKKLKKSILHYVYFSYLTFFLSFAFLTDNFFSVYLR